MKKILLSIFVALLAIISEAQERHVIAFDCTRSMIYPTGRFAEEYEDTTVLWGPAKSNIKSLWDSANDDDEFVIVLFQTEVLDIIECTKKSMSWSLIERKMNSAIKKGGNTCIFNAWVKAENYFKDNCIFYIITDGVEDHDNKLSINNEEQEHIDRICEKIDSFCKNKTMRGYYSNLKSVENENISNQIAEKIRNSECFNHFLCLKIKHRELSLDQSDVEKRKKIFTVECSSTEEKRPNVSNLAIDFVDKTYKDYFDISIEGSKIENGELKLIVRIIRDVPIEMLSNENDLSFAVKLFSNDNAKEHIIPQEMTIKVLYYLEKIAYFPEEFTSQKLEFTPPFIIDAITQKYSNNKLFTEKMQNTVVINFDSLLDSGSMFNDEALKRGGAYKVRMENKNKASENMKLKLYYNGNECDDRSFWITTTDTAHEVKIIFQLDKDIDEGSYKYYFCVDTSCDIDKINNFSNLSEFSSPIEFKYDKKVNYINLLLVLICIFVVCILLYFLIKKITEPKFKFDELVLCSGNINDNNTLCRLRGIESQKLIYLNQSKQSIEVSNRRKINKNAIGGNDIYLIIRPKRFSSEKNIEEHGQSLEYKTSTDNNWTDFNCMLITQTAGFHYYKFDNNYRIYFKN